MKKLSCFLVAMLFLLMPALQSCDDNDGYSIGQFGGSWATVRVLSGNTYYLDSDYYGTLCRQPAMFMVSGLWMVKDWLFFLILYMIILITMIWLSR